MKTGKKNQLKEDKWWENFYKLSRREEYKRKERRVKPAAQQMRKNLRAKGVVQTLKIYRGS